MKWFLIFTLTAFSSQVFAQNVPMPVVFTVKTLSTLFRDILSQKVQDLSNNYIAKVVDNRVEFSSNNEVACNSGDEVQPKKPLAAIQYTYSPTKTGLIEQVDYVGCRGKITFSENIVTEGISLTPSWSLVLKGKREFELSLNETRRTISYIVNDRIKKFSVMKFDTLRTGERVITRFYLKDKLALTMIESPGIEASVLSYELPEHIDIDFHFLGNEFEREAHFSQGTRNLRALALPTGRIIYSIGPVSETSLEAFQNAANGPVITAVIGSMNSIINLLLKDFPATELISSGEQTSKFFEELTLVQFILNTNGPIQQVKTIIRDIISAIKNGDLVIDDRRGKQK
ncbi:MAG: hypothetical protein SGI74_00990 [Oligoflexia bacterium]|nr:hypothetical protein [Oligoflexia bacterium]